MMDIIEGMMGLPDLFGEVLPSYAEMMACDMGIYNGEELDPLHNGSYGRKQGLLEIMGLLTDEELEHDTVAGYLTADDVFGRIKRHFEEKGEKDGNI